MAQKSRNEIISFDANPYDELKITDLYTDSILPEKKRQRKKKTED
jgi:hypothetical protein